MSPSSRVPIRFFGLWGEGQWTDEIRFAEQRVEITALDIPFGGEGFRPVGVETSDAALRTLGDGRHAASDGPHAHDAECAPLHFAPEDGAFVPICRRASRHRSAGLAGAGRAAGRRCAFATATSLAPGVLQTMISRATAAGMSIMSRPTPSLATQRRLGRASSRAASRWRSFPEITMSARWRRAMKRGSSTVPPRQSRISASGRAASRSSCSLEKGREGAGLYR